MAKKNNYSEADIQSLDWKQHIRHRPGMYIGKLGDGSMGDDGIYVLLKEILDNSVDEYVMGAGLEIDIQISDHEIVVRDYGRGIPQGKLVDCVSKINTGGKYDSRAFQKSVGLNGVGVKVVNALSSKFCVTSWRSQKSIEAIFERGILTNKPRKKSSSQPDGTAVTFYPDESLFPDFRFRLEFVEEMVWNYAFLNSGLTLKLNSKPFLAPNGLRDLMERHTKQMDVRYPIIHLQGEDVEVALTHGDRYGEEYRSFVNGQHTTMGGTHQSAFREVFAKTIKDFYGKDYDPNDIRNGLVAALSVRVIEPVFESQTKTKLGSLHRKPGGVTMRSWMSDFLKKTLDDFLHRQAATAEAMKAKINQSERERRDLAGIRKIATERAKKANVFNKKLRDCRVYFSSKSPKKNESTLFITEGDSASGSLTKARCVQTQAVFSLRGKPLNTFGLTRKVVYENEEFNLLQHALNIEASLDGLRYNRVVLATDADVDGMHIRLLLMTFFIQYFPELVRAGHIFVLQTPLFRVRNPKKTIYCYNETEKAIAIKTLRGQPEVTRFKGLGEISPNEFQQFIGKKMRLQPVVMDHSTPLKQMLRYYMGKNSGDRQEFIINNLRYEQPILEA